MFKNGIKQSKNYIAAISLGVTMSTIYVAVIAHASATSFKAGYLSYFNVDIRSVDYWPSIIDFMNEPILVLLAIVTFTVLSAATFLLMNALNYLLHKIANKVSWKWLIGITDEKFIGQKVASGILIVFVLFLSFKIPFNDSFERGIEAAKNQTSFTQVKPADVENQILIYQYNGTGITKEYNVSTRSFTKAYKTINVTGKEFESIELDTKANK